MSLFSHCVSSIEWRTCRSIFVPACLPTHRCITSEFTLTLTLRDRTCVWFVRWMRRNISSPFSLIMTEHSGNLNSAHCVTQTCIYPTLGLPPVLFLHCTSQRSTPSILKAITRAVIFPSILNPSTTSVRLNRPRDKGCCTHKVQGCLLKAVGGWNYSTLFCIHNRLSLSKAPPPLLLCLKVPWWKTSLLWCISFWKPMFVQDIRQRGSY